MDSDCINQKSKTEALRTKTERLLDRPDASIEGAIQKIEEMMHSRKKTSIEGLDDSLHVIPPSVPRSHWNALGKLIVRTEERTISQVDGSCWLSLRLDGHGFKKTVTAMRDAGILEVASSYPARLENVMQNCLQRLMNETKAKIGFTHSDEFVVFIPPANRIDGKQQPHMHNGRSQKLTTLASGFVSSCFTVSLIQQCCDGNSSNMETLLDTLGNLSPHFDCRLGFFRSWEEALGLLLWRAYDCSVNGVSDAIQHHSTVEMNRKGTIDKLVWLKEKGLLPLPRHQAYGTLMVKSKKIKIVDEPVLELFRKSYLKNPEDLAPSVSRGSAVQNIQHDEDYKVFRNRNHRMRDLKERATENNITLPQNRDGRDACPSYHIVGNCNTNCKTAYDHRHQNDEEKSNMLMWCREVFALFDEPSPTEQEVVHRSLQGGEEQQQQQEVDKTEEDHQQRISLIVTGFGPFRGVAENPSTILVKEFQNYLEASDNAAAWKRKLSTRIEKHLVLETSAKGVCHELDALATEIKERNGRHGDDPRKPKTRIVLLHLGVNYQGTGFQVEQCAYNDASFRVPDEQGYQPQKTAIFSGQDVGATLNTTLNVETLVHNQTLLYPNIETKISRNPGRFVCNYLYCYSLNKLQSSPEVQCLFLHIPHFKVVSKETQLAYCSDLLRQLANIDNESLVLDATK